MLRKGMAVLSAIILYVGPAGAVVPQADIDQALGQITTDSVLVSGWLVDQLKKAVPFNATSGMVVPQQLKLFGIEVGVEGVVSATKVDVDGFHRLPTTIVDAQTLDISEDTLPFPSIIAHAKVGLPFGLDGGIRMGGIPKKSFDSEDSRVTIKNSIFGIDIRKKIIEEGVAKPFGLTVGLNYTHASGYIEATAPYTSNLGTTVVATQSYSSTLNATGSNRAEWSVNSVGLQAIVNKKIAIVNPYLGVSANHNSGSIDNRLTTAGTLTLTDTSNAANTASTTVGTAGSASAKPEAWNVRALAGLELTILPFMRLGLHGEYAGSNKLAGAIGLRAQFR